MGKLRMPVTKKKNACRKHGGFRSAVASMQGWRKTMEDSHRVSLKLPGHMKDCAFLGVFDGHGGKKVAEYTSKNLLQRISKSMPDSLNDGNGMDATKQLVLKNSIIKGFLELDDTMRKSKKIDDESGSTAVCVFVTPSHFCFANCGDSRAILCRENKVHFATTDHKPTLKEERRRIECGGGTVIRNRVDGSLALSRALGDFEYKDNADKGQCDQKVIPLPDVTIIERDDQIDEFLILACDGIFDVMTNCELLSFIKTQMTRTDKLKEICNNVVDHCLKIGSGDNMSIIILTLPGCPKPDDLKKKRKMDLQCMHKAIYCKKTSSSGLNVGQCRTSSNSTVIAGISLMHPNNNMGAPACTKNKSPNAFIRYYLDYLKTHRGNLCRLAKRCGHRWTHVDKRVKVKYRRRYLYAKRKSIKKFNQSAPA